MIFLRNTVDGTLARPLVVAFARDASDKTFHTPYLAAADDNLAELMADLGLQAQDHPYTPEELKVIADVKTALIATGIAAESIEERMLIVCSMVSVTCLRLTTLSCVAPSPVCPLFLIHSQCICEQGPQVCACRWHYYHCTFWHDRLPT